MESHRALVLRLSHDVDIVFKEEFKSFPAKFVTTDRISGVVIVARQLQGKGSESKGFPLF